jgi:hypothetical protein
MEMETPDVQHGEHSARPTVPRFSLGIAGLLLVVLGVWGGIVPFIGPTFGFSADGAGSWYWDLLHALLSLAPGAAALVAGLLIMTGAGTRVFHSALTGLAGFLAVLAGGWFVIGAIAWPLLYNSGVIVSAPPATTLEYFVGYYGGVGCLLIFLGAFVLGRSAAAQKSA